MDPLTRKFAQTINHLSTIYPSSTLDLHKKLVTRNYNEKTDCNPLKIMTLMNGRSERQRETTEAMKQKAEKVSLKSFKSEIYNKQKKIYRVFGRMNQEAQSKLYQVSQQTMYTMDYQDVPSKSEIEAERDAKVIRAAAASRASLSLSPEQSARQRAVHQKARLIDSILGSEVASQGHEASRNQIAGMRTVEMRVDLNNFNLHTTTSSQLMPDRAPAALSSMPASNRMLPYLQTQYSSVGRSPTLAAFPSNAGFSPGKHRPGASGVGGWAPPLGNEVHLLPIIQPNKAPRGKPLLQFSEGSAHQSLKT